MGSTSQESEKLHSRVSVSGAGISDFGHVIIAFYDVWLVLWQIRNMLLEAQRGIDTYKFYESVQKHEWRFLIICINFF